MRAGFYTHRLAMLVSVHLDYDIEAFLESIAIGGETHDGKNDAAIRIVGADAEDFGNEAGVDVVAGRGSSITSENGEVRTCYSKR